MITFFVDLEIAARSLIQHRRRTLLLGGAIAAVTALFAILSGLSAGVEEAMVHTATTLVSGHLNVGGYYKVTRARAAPVLTDSSKVLDLARKSLPEISYAVERGRGWAKVVSDASSMQAAIGGIDIDTEPAFKEVVQLRAGNIDDLAQPGTVLLFEKQATKLDVGIGDVLTISAATTRGISNTLDVRVVAIAKDLGLLSTWNIYVPARSLRALYQLNESSTGAIQIHLIPEARGDLDAIASRLRSTLEAEGYRIMNADPTPFWMKLEKISREDWTGQKLDITTWEDELAFFSWTLSAIRALSFVLISILLCIVIVGIMNTMWIAIRERTREIGTLRAIGMQRTSVLSMFMLEAMILGFAGALVGAGLGTLSALVINLAEVTVPTAAKLFLLTEYVHLSTNQSPLIGCLLMTFVAAFAAVYPSWRAARLEPVDAMHHFG